MTSALAIKPRARPRRLASQDWSSTCQRLGTASKAD